MTTDICTPEELDEFAAISAWLKERKLRMRCRDTARRKPKEVRITVERKSDNKIVMWA